MRKTGRTVKVEDRRRGDRVFDFLGACLIAAVRLAREDKWDNSPRVAARIGDAINLARRIYGRMRAEFPQM
jgi:hypothetical protein